MAKLVWRVGLPYSTHLFLPVPPLWWSPLGALGQGTQSKAGSKPRREPLAALAAPPHPSCTLGERGAGRGLWLWVPARGKGLERGAQRPLLTSQICALWGGAACPHAAAASFQGMFAAAVSLVTGKILYISDQVASIFHCKRDAFFGARFVEFLAPHDVSVFHASTTPYKLPPWSMCSGAGEVPRAVA